LLLFGHVGITVGAAVAGAGLIRRKEKENPMKALSRYADMRLLVIGSLLPDLIDKPVGQYLFKSTFNNGRIFSHSLLFLIVLSAAGWLLYKRKRETALLTLGAGTFTHLVLDQMWGIPQTLFWPTMGWAFPKVNLENYASGLLKAMYTTPDVYIPEIIGFIIVAWYAAEVIRRKQFWSFLKTGRAG
jgi:inner membrane protein